MTLETVADYVNNESSPSLKQYRNTSYKSHTFNTKLIRMTLNYLF